MNRFFLVLIFFSFPLIIFSQEEITDEETLRGKEQLRQETENKSEKKDSIPITDYKYFFSNGIERIVDTTLTIYKDYKFNFIREDDFELLSFPNVGHTYNKLGYNFKDQLKLPQVGARGKHFSYFEIEDIPYFNTPTPYTELFAKSTFEQGQILDALISLNLTPEYNFAIAHKGYKSLGKYVNSRSRGNQFRFSSNFVSKNNKTIWRLHFTSQNLFNQENGGLDSDSIYFFEQAPDYFVLDNSGNQIINEDGSYEMIYYDGYLDRSRLGPMTFAENSLYSKRFFSDIRKTIIGGKEKKLLEIGYQFTHEYKKIEYVESLENSNFFGDKLDGFPLDRSRLYFQENKIYLKSYINKLGEFNLGLRIVNWENFYDDYEEDLSELTFKLDKQQINYNISWAKRFSKFNFDIELNKSSNDDLASNFIKFKINSSPLRNIETGILFSNSTRSPNLNFILFRSIFNHYNWYNENLQDQKTSNAHFNIAYKDLLRISADYYIIDNYTYFKETANSLNGEIDIKRLASPFQAPDQIKYYKIKIENHNRVGKFSIINTAQYQKKEQNNLDTNELTTLNVPEWVTRNTLLYSNYVFNNSLFLQTGITFNFFTKFYADYYNTLLSEFVTQNYKEIGEYPRFDFFVNATIQNTRIFIKVEHLNSSFTGYDYYSDPFNPYRDLSVRFGVVWNFFE